MRYLRTTLLSLVLLLGCKPATPAVPATQPNLLLLVIDCLRADHVSANGYSRPTTPTLDRLAAEGTNFTRAYSQASWTRPSLPTILSGLYPSEHGLLAFEAAGAAVTSTVVAPEVELVSEALKGLGWSTALIGDQFQLAPRFGLDQGFDFYRYKTSGATNINTKFLEWLGARPAEAPWFAYLHYLDIHWPYCPPKAIRGRFDPGKSDIDFCHEWRKLRDDIHAGRVVLDKDDVETMRARYDEELLGVDGKIGEVLAALEARGELANTLILVTSDHGEEFMERGAIGHGQSLHEELTAVPLIVRPPSGWSAPRGVRVDHPVELRSVKPTLVQGAGGVPASDEAPSLLPWALGWRTDEIQPFAVSESVEDVAVRSREWTLLARKDGSSATLYERATDPAERVDLARERRRELAALRAQVELWKAALRPRTAAANSTELDSETEQGLRALGYLGGGDGATPAPAPAGPPPDPSDSDPADNDPANGEPANTDPPSNPAEGTP